MADPLGRIDLSHERDMRLLHRVPGQHHGEDDLEPDDHHGIEQASDDPEECSGYKPPTVGLHVAEKLAVSLGRHANHFACAHLGKLFAADLVRFGHR